MGFLSRYRVFIGVRINVRVFTMISLIHASVFEPIPYYYSSIVKPKIRDSDASRRSIIVQDSFSYPWLLVFPYEVECCSVKVCKELCWDFDVDCIQSAEFFW